MDTIEFYAQIVSILLGLALIVLSIFISKSWRRDNSILCDQAKVVTQHCHNDIERIMAISGWVHANKGFEKNKNYFLSLPILGATPIDVLRNGGDCSDKSRLVAAMLNEVGIKAGLVMLRKAVDQPFTHTVVEAIHERGRMVVDPVWDIAYPGGIEELAAVDPGPQLVLELQQLRGPQSKIMSVLYEDVNFKYATSINWNKNRFTRFIAAMMRVGGIDPNTIMRPRIFEDPKYLSVWLTLGIALLSLSPIFIIFAVKGM